MLRHGIGIGIVGYGIWDLWDQFCLFWVHVEERYTLGPLTQQTFRVKN